MDLFTQKRFAKIFFVGIGGISMSALALYLKDQGFIVSGSDRTPSKVTETLVLKGIEVFIGHKKENVKGCGILVTTSAVDKSNEEVAFAIENKIPIVERALLLKLISDTFPKKIGVSGSHGKTTTTALISNIFLAANKNFTSFIGGEDYRLSNYYNAGHDYLISEVCEFRRNIDRFDPTIGLTLNIDNDHLDSYNGFSDLVDTFFSYLDRAQTPVLNYDDRLLRKYPKPCVSFGFDENADFHAANVRQGARLKFDVFYKENKYLSISSSLSGRHNVYNILSAVCVGGLFGINAATISKAVFNFCGVKRRNEFIGYINGAKAFVDYAHHPMEIKAVLTAVKAQNKNKKLIVVFQPHTYSRTRILFEDFIKVLLTVEQLYIYATYSAREDFDPVYNSQTLASAIIGSEFFADFNELFDKLKLVASKKTVIYFIGAGDVADKAKAKLKDLG